MKKLLVLATLIMVMGLGACSTSPAPYDDTTLLDQISDMESEVLQQQEDIQDLLDLINAFETYDDTSILGLITAIEDFDSRNLEIEDELLQSQLDTLNLAVVALQTRLDNLTVVTGLNGTVSYYENTDVLLDEQIDLLRMSVIELKDTLDKAKCPQYLLDVNEEFISFEQLGALLKMKYYGVDVIESDILIVGFQVKMDMTVNADMTQEEFIARTILLIQELQQYEFYIISSSELYLRLKLITPTYRYDAFEIKIPLATMLADFITITVDGIYDEDYNMTINYVTFDKELVQTYYDDFVLSGEFNTYVLNFE